jgi:hypothetical protein
MLVVNEPAAETVSTAATLPCQHVVLQNPRRTAGLVWLGVIVLVFCTPVAGVGLGWIGAVLALLASLASFIQAARVRWTRRLGGSVVLEAGAVFGAFTIGFVALWPLLFAWLGVASALRHSLGHYAELAALAMTVLSTALVVNVAGVDLVPPAYPGGKPSIRVLRRKGSPLALPTIAAPRDRVEGLSRRIDEAVRAHAGGGSRGLDALARGGRPASVWQIDVRRLALAPPTFRDQALGIDDYERVLGDAATPPDQRIGAALALRTIDPEQGPTRIRVAADASADDAMREALNAAAEGEVDDSLLERAASRRAIR